MLSSVPVSVTSRLPEYGIYVCCLASRNCGDSFGRWIDLTLTSDKEDIEEAITSIIKNSPHLEAEEYEIEDTTGLPDFLYARGFPDLELVSEFMQTLLKFDSELDHDAYFMLCEYEDRVFTETQFRGRFQGVYASTAEFAQEYYAEQNITDFTDSELYGYLDWEKVWRGQMACTGASALEHRDGVCIFW